MESFNFLSITFTKILEYVIRVKWFITIILVVFNIATGCKNENYPVARNERREKSSFHENDLIGSWRIGGAGEMTFKRDGSVEYTDNSTQIHFQADNYKAVRELINSQDNISVVLSGKFRTSRDSNNDSIIIHITWEKINNTFISKKTGKVFLLMDYSYNVFMNKNCLFYEELAFSKIE